MRADRVFAGLLGLGLIVLILPLGLGLRLTPCLAIGSACWFDVVGSVCHLLDRAGLHQRIALVGIGLLAIAAVTIGQVIWSIRRQLRATRQFLATLHPSARDGRLARAARHVGLIERVTLIAGAGAFSGCIGFWRPRILVSEDLVQTLTARQLEAILWHERYHAERRDPLRLLIGRALRDGLSWFPLVGALERYFELLTELAADRQAVMKQGGPAGLAGALYHLLTRPVALPSAAAIAGSTQTTARIDSLLNPAWQPRLHLSLAEWGPAVGLGVLALCLLFL